MKYLSVLLACLLTGCVTIVTPGQASFMSGEDPERPECEEYEPPLERTPPAKPMVGDPQGNYVEFLEGFAEQVARYARDLETHLSQRERDHEMAYLEYRFNLERCKNLSP